MRNPAAQGKADANQKEIMKALEQVGCTIEDASSMGKGFPDLIVGRAGVTYLLEVKSEKGKLNPTQTEWHDEWRGQKAIVRSPIEAIQVVCQHG